jgi:hypothetical protein
MAILNPLKFFLVRRMYEESHVLLEKEDIESLLDCAKKVLGWAEVVCGFTS